MAQHPTNHLLQALSAGDFNFLQPQLQSIELVRETVLVEAGAPLTHVYLPESGIVSIVSRLSDGQEIEIAMTGRDSIFGTFSALGDPTALNSAVVLIPGVASTLDVDRLRAAADQSATFRATLVRHGLAVYAQIQQTVGCNASHSVESRLARCLLQTRDLAGSDKLVLTQESMAQMIGARRNSVSLVAHALQQAGIICYSRGHIEINDLRGLAKTSCECYRIVKIELDRLLNSASSRYAPRG